MARGSEGTRHVTKQPERINTLYGEDIQKHNVSDIAPCILSTHFQSGKVTPQSRFPGRVTKIQNTHKTTILKTNVDRGKRNQKSNLAKPTMVHFNSYLFVPRSSMLLPKHD